MNIYYFDQQTGEYLTQSIANQSPQNPDEYLIPANATKVQPPETAENEAAIFSGEEWVIKDDYRGETYNNPDTGEEFIITDIGITPKSEWADGKIEENLDTLYQTKIDKLKDKAKDILRETDWYYTRRLETDESIPQEVINYRQSVRAYTEQVEDDLLDLKNNSDAPKEDLKEYEFVFPTRS